MGILTPGSLQTSGAAPNIPGSLPADFGLASSYNHMSQFPEINSLSLPFHPFYWFCFSGEPLLIHCLTPGIIAWVSPFLALTTGKIPVPPPFQQRLEQRFPGRLLLRASYLHETGYKAGSDKPLDSSHVSPVIPGTPQRQELNKQQLMRVISQVPSASSSLSESCWPVFVLG